VLLVGDFFQAALDMRLIDSGARFPYARPGDSILEPYLDAVKEWFFGPVLDWLFGDKSKPLPRRDLEREVPRSEDTKGETDRLGETQEQRGQERQREKERLLDLLRQKREQREREQLERNR